MAPAKEKRRNGGTWPPHPLQATSWVMFTALVGTFYALYVPYLDFGGRIAAGIVFGFFAISAFVAAAYATIVDPADKHIHLPESTFEGRRAPAGLLFCYRCERHVQETSKHCIVCNKCVDGYDHHCVWLNNCVGIHNYLAFITALISASGMLIVMFSIGVYLLVQFSNSRADFEERAQSVYPALSGQAYTAITTTVWVVSILTLALILQLLAFHSYLIDHNITTYDFVMARSRVDYDSAEQEDTECKKECAKGAEACKPEDRKDPCKPRTQPVDGPDCCRPAGPPRDHPHSGQRQGGCQGQAANGQARGCGASAESGGCCGRQQKETAGACAPAEDDVCCHSVRENGPPCCKPGADCRDGQCDGAPPPEYSGKGSVVSMWKARNAAGNLDGVAHLNADKRGPKSAQSGGSTRGDGVGLELVTKKSGSGSAGAAAGGSAAGIGGAGAARELLSQPLSIPAQGGSSAGAGSTSSSRPGSASTAVTARAVSLEGMGTGEDAEAGGGSGAVVVQIQDWVTRTSAPAKPAAAHERNTGKSDAASASQFTSTRAGAAEGEGASVTSQQSDGHHSGSKSGTGPRTGASSDSKEGSPRRSSSHSDSSSSAGDGPAKRASAARDTAIHAHESDSEYEGGQQSEDDDDSHLDEHEAAALAKIGGLGSGVGIGPGSSPGTGARGRHSTSDLDLDLSLRGRTETDVEGAGARRLALSLGMSSPNAAAGTGIATASQIQGQDEEIVSVPSDEETAVEEGNHATGEQEGAGKGAKLSPQARSAARKGIASQVEGRQDRKEAEEEEMDEEEAVLRSGSGRRGVVVGAALERSMDKPDPESSDEEQQPQTKAEQGTDMP